MWHSATVVKRHGPTAVPLNYIHGSTSLSGFKSLDRLVTVASEGTVIAVAELVHTVDVLSTLR